MSTIANALFGSTRQAVLRLFFSNPDERFYIRDTIRRLNIGTGGVQKELARLAAAGILGRVRDGNQIYYKANQECPIFVELRAICSKTFGVADVLRQALQPIFPRIRGAFIYGSVAAGTERAESDIDLMVIGESLKLSEVIPLLAPASTQLFREVNPSVYTSAEFSSKLREKKHFLSRVMDGPKIPIIGSADELRGLAKERLGKAAPE